MVLIDYIFIFITLAYSLMGMLRGFSSHLLSFISWSLMIYLIFFHFSYFTGLVSDYISLEYKFIRVITIVLLIILTLMLIFLLNLTLAKLLATTIFEHTNRIFGLVISLMKSQIYIFVFILVILDTSFHSKIIGNSVLIPYYLPLIEYISDYDNSLFNSF